MKYQLLKSYEQTNNQNRQIVSTLQRRKDYAQAIASPPLNADINHITKNKKQNAILNQNDKKIQENNIKSEEFQTNQVKQITSRQFWQNKKSP